MFTFTEVPAGDDHAVGAAFVPVKISILFEPSARGGLAVAAIVTVYPFAELVVTVVSIAPIFVLPDVNVPKGMVLAVVVTFVVAVLTVPPELTAASENEKVGSTEAVIEIDVPVNTANATVFVSIAAAPASFVVTRTKVVVFIVVGLVMPAVRGTVTAVTVCVVAVVTVTVAVQFELPVPVHVPLVADAVYPVPAIPVTVPSVGEAARIIPVGAVHVPDDVVQY